MGWASRHTFKFQALKILTHLRHPPVARVSRCFQVAQTSQDSTSLKDTLVPIEPSRPQGLKPCTIPCILYSAFGFLYCRCFLYRPQTLACARLLLGRVNQVGIFIMSFREYRYVTSLLCFDRELIYFEHNSFVAYRGFRHVLKQDQARKRRRTRKKGDDIIDADAMNAATSAQDQQGDAPSLDV
ncbi:hypothetical protein B0H14DRAFT_2879893 [Mycena olivaceomarginata]|nr:hypothetical protein B0H14DRAFT_2879893 [Mycena olivaceomarginata]